MSHTPGPWHTYEVGTGYLAVADLDGDGLGYFARSKGGIDECRANAIMSAAAPDLLAALKRVRAEIPTAELDYNSLVPTIEAAIAKAEGRT